MNLHVLRSAELAALSGFIGALHEGPAGGPAALAAQVFARIEEVIPNSFCSLDDFELATGRAFNANSALQPAPGWVVRLNELVPREHPAFPLIAANRCAPLRVHDLVSDRALRRTDLYQEIFRPVGGGHQIVLPMPAPGRVAGLTINRDKPFSAEDLAVAALLAPHVQRAYERARGGADPLIALTVREGEVLARIRAGLTDAQIARDLGVARRTVSKHVERVLAKLGVESRAAAAATR